MWILDSGASHHMCSYSSCFVSMSPSSSFPIMTSDGTSMGFTNIGSIITPNVYHIPKLTFNLASVGQLSDFANLVMFSSSSCYV